jgi:methyl-accepting chemotaxis protein
MTIKQKIIAIGIFITMIIFLALGIYFYQDEKKKIINSYIELSKGVISTAESTRDQMEKKWDLGVLNIEHAREYAKKQSKRTFISNDTCCYCLGSSRRKS